MEEHPEARLIVETLSREGFVAYYAGGWVRDFLLRHPSDDIDIATNAPPETIQALFPHTVPIGIAFGIILVVIGKRSYEVATFRQDFDYRDGRRPTRVEFSRAEEDAKRRDFTINGMFYDPVKGEVIDYVEGRRDLARKIIRAIGDPHARIREDRLRMVRAVRLACRFGFQIEPETQEAIRAHAKELFPAVAIERVCQELTKGHAFGTLPAMLRLLHVFGLLGALFPQLESLSLEEIDQRLQPLFLYPQEAPLVAFLWSLLGPENAHIDLVSYLKLSNRERDFLAFWRKAKERFARPDLIEDVEWAYFYAHPDSTVVVDVYAAHQQEDIRNAFLLQHRTRRQELAFAIRRILEKKPLVQAADLLALGIQPGPEMGLLLKEAERIAISQRLESAEKVLQYLKRHR